MGETYSRYRQIWHMLKTMYPEEPRGHVASRLNTLVAFICGIIGSRQTRLPAIAGEIPSACQENSQIQK